MFKNSTLFGTSFPLLKTAQKVRDFEIKYVTSLLQFIILNNIIKQLILCTFKLRYNEINLLSFCTILSIQTNNFKGNN